MVEKKERNRRVHMANERTFLAWIRTSIGIMAFGFVLEKFSLFLKQLAFIMGKGGLPSSPGYSSFVGIFLIGIGALMTILSFVRYRRVMKQIEEDTYTPSSSLDVMLTITVLAICLFLMIYLIHSL